MESIGELLDQILELKAKLRNIERDNIKSKIDLLKFSKFKEFDTDKAIIALEGQLKEFKY